MIKGYYLEALYPRFSLYRAIVINRYDELNTYAVSVRYDEKVEDKLHGYIDLGGILG